MRILLRLICLLGVGMVTLSVLAKDKQAGPQQMSNLRFKIVKDDNNKPVRNASVILHPVNKDGSQAKGGFQLKTDGEGNTATEGIPYGRIRIQVMAPGMQTFGEDYEVNQPVMDIAIRLKRPGEQMSIYDKPQTTQPAAPRAAPPSEPKPN